MPEFKMPSLGADMEAATLVEWKVAPGEQVKRGQVIAVVETDKGAIDVESLDDGVVDHLLITPWTKVAVGTVMATLRSVGPVPVPESVPEPGRPQGPPLHPVPAAPAPQPAPESVPEPGRPQGPPLRPVSESGSPRQAASPAARVRARELGLDLATMTGTGPGGVITIADVERAPPAAPVRRASSGFDPAAMRRAIATRMARSKREIPHYYLATEIDFAKAQAWLELENKARSVSERLVPAALLLKATALAARQFPELNGHFVDDAFKRAEHVRLGIAIALRGGGLTVGGVDHAEAMSLEGLMNELGAMVERARAGRMRASDLSDPSITVTNLGAQGVTMALPIIFPPQVAMVGFGRITERPWVVDGQVVARPIVTATLAADHRVSDGHRGGLFLHAVERHLLDPETLR